MPTSPPMTMQLASVRQTMANSTFLSSVQDPSVHHLKASDTVLPSLTQDHLAVAHFAVDSSSSMKVFIPGSNLDAAQQIVSSSLPHTCSAAATQPTGALDVGSSLSSLGWERLNRFASAATTHSCQVLRASAAGVSTGSHLSAPHRAMCSTAKVDLLLPFWRVCTCYCRLPSLGYHKCSHPHSSMGKMQAVGTTVTHAAISPFMFVSNWSRDSAALAFLMN
jgi:hypothetical protein